MKTLMKRVFMPNIYIDLKINWYPKKGGSNWNGWQKAVHAFLRKIFNS
jgi:phage pi2 protein 07